ncbi:MAG TPA: hypothetical protein G4O14_02900 [Anaerolineae bacterium]|nr:hypothetical protein [Anaerolineae bacterium]
MEEPQNLLRHNPLPWLLEDENPSVRYWTLVDILDRPKDDPEVLKTRSEIAKLSLVKELFDLQHRDGHWGEDESKALTARGTVGVLMHLFELGVAPDGRTHTGCDSLLRNSQNENGGISMVKTRRSGIVPCTTGGTLPMLVHFNMDKDPRVVSAFSFLEADMSSEDALDCGRYEHRDCLWGAIAALTGLAVLPQDMRSPSSTLVINQLCEELLRTDYDFDGEHKRWLTFRVPQGWDLLSAIQMIGVHGFGVDPRLKPLLDLALSLQDEQGRWKCGSVTQNWPLDRRNRPSKWVTLYALRALKAIGYEFL